MRTVGMPHAAVWGATQAASSLEGWAASLSASKSPAHRRSVAQFIVAAVGCVCSAAMASEGSSGALKRSGTALDSDDDDDVQVARHVSKKPRNRYVMDEADESDGEGGVAKEGDDDGGSVDSYEDDGFVDKKESAEKADNDSAGSDDNDSSDDDSDDSDGSDSGSDAAASSKKKPKRRLVAKKDIQIDEDDRALLQENRAAGMAAAGHIVNDEMSEFMESEVSLCRVLLSVSCWQSLWGWGRVRLLNWFCLTPV